MSYIVNQIKWIMLLTGFLTCSMFYAVILPRAALVQTFGVALEGPLVDVVVRSWGGLITLMGGMLIYASFDPVVRRFVAFVVATSKLVYVGLILLFGGQYLSKVWLVVGFDALVGVTLFVYVYASMWRKTDLAEHVNA